MRYSYGSSSGSISGSFDHQKRAQWAILVLITMRVGNC